MSNLRWTPEMVTKVRKLVAEGNSYAAVGERLGLTAKRIGNVVRGEGFAPKSRVVVTIAAPKPRPVARPAKACKWPSGSGREMHICCRAQELACDADAA